MLVQWYNEFTTITNKLAVNPLQICHSFREKMSLNTPYLGLYILLISVLQNAGNAISEVSEMENFLGETPPGPPKKVEKVLFPAAFWSSFEQGFKRITEGRLVFRLSLQKTVCIYSVHQIGTYDYYRKLSTSTVYIRLARMIITENCLHLQCTSDWHVWLLQKTVYVYSVHQIGTYDYYRKLSTSTVYIRLARMRKTGSPWIRACLKVQILLTFHDYSLR